VEKYFFKRLTFDLSYLIYMGAGKHGLVNWLAIPCTKQQEKQMKKNNEARFTEKLKQYGFKKKETGEKGFHMWEMSPADLESRQRIHDNLKKEEKENA
jgi:hypothetical protein